MPELTDYELLAEYVRTESEEAFATLVLRYVNLVYSTALRGTGNPHHADEISQAVFIILARKAGKLSDRVVLSGWLYQTARLTAANFVKGEIRRQQREQEAYMQSTLTEPESVAWQQIAPLLDDAMGSLSEADRNAVVLRFFENKTAGEIAAFLKISEATAHKRTARSLKKLRKLFSKRGVFSTTSDIAGAISANSLRIAPPALAKSITLLAAGKGAAATGSTLGLVKGAVKIMSWTKVKTTIVVATVAIIMAAGGSYLVLNHQKHPRQPGKLTLPRGEGTPEVSFGRTHGIILAPDGSLWAWGENDLGWPALGLGTINYTAFLKRIGGDNDWASIAAGGSHNLALKKDGSLWGWGQNLRNELGTQPSYLPPKNRQLNPAVESPVKSVLGNDWRQIAAGNADSFGIKTNGTLWAWGLNNFGQLGIGSFTSIRAPLQIGSNTWRTISAEFVSAGGIQTDGTLWAWGGGPLTGNTVTLSAKDDYPAPVRISDNTNWMDVSVGDNVVFALNSDGTIWAWGYTASLYTAVPGAEATLTQVGKDNDWEKISCSSRFLVLIKKDGSLWTLKSPEFGKPAQLKQISLHKEIVAIGGGGGLGAAITRDGEVWTWGRTIGEDVTRFSGSGKNMRQTEAKFHVFDQPWQLSNNDP